MVTFFITNPGREVSAISILVSFRGLKFRRSTGESIPVEYWNKNKKRAKVTANFHFGNDINYVLGKLEAAANRAILSFKDWKLEPRKEDFFTALDREYYKKETEVATVLFLEYMQTYIDRYKDVRSHITIKKYITTLNKLKLYETKKRKRLRFEDINIDFYNDFQKWIYSQNYSDNYFGSVIKNIKQVYKEARSVDKLHMLEDIQHRDFIATAKDSDNIYLSDVELKRIHNLKLTEELILKYFPTLTENRIMMKIASLRLIKDRFLIGAYTGLRVSDFNRLSDINIGEKYIRIKTTKTGADTIIPIHPIIREILDNGFDSTVTVSDQKINKHIKEIALMADINEMVLTNKHIAGKVIQNYDEKYKLVCTHTARRSFATNAYKAGIPTIAIMKITGHKKESTFLKYIKVSSEENAEILLSHPFFTKSE